LEEWKEFKDLLSREIKEGVRLSQQPRLIVPALKSPIDAPSRLRVFAGFDRLSLANSPLRATDLLFSGLGDFKRRRDEVRGIYAAVAFQLHALIGVNDAPIFSRIFPTGLPTLSVFTPRSRLWHRQTPFSISSCAETAAIISAEIELEACAITVLRHPSATPSSLQLLESRRASDTLLWLIEPMGYAFGNLFSSIFESFNPAGTRAKLPQQLHKSA